MMEGSSTTTVLSLCIVMVSFFHVLVGAAAVASSKAPQKLPPVVVPPPAIFVFGDGNVDVGNNNYLEANDAADPIKANHPYYGIDFPHSKPTGRFSNGHNLADFIAKTMGLKISPPAYLSLPGQRIKSLKGFTGVNYASAEAGIWNITNFNWVSIHLLLQVDYFAATRAQLKAKLGSGGKLKKLLSKSVFLLAIGTRDIFEIKSQEIGGNLYDTHGTLDVPSLLTSYGVGITALYNLGARKFAVVNVPPLGSAPESGPFGEAWDVLAREFNDGLEPLLASLSSKLKGLRYSIADFYGFSNATFTNPSAAGFVDTETACCKFSCTEPPCQNRKQFWFWDELYITERAAKLAVAAFYNGPAQYTVPINFKKLVQGK